jgi:hypothetical protein
MNLFIGAGDQHGVELVPDHDILMDNVKSRIRDPLTGQFVDKVKHVPEGLHKRILFRNGKEPAGIWVQK